MKQYTKLFNFSCIGVIIISMIVPVNAVSASGSSQDVLSVISESKNISVDATSVKAGLAGITTTDIRELDEIANNVTQATLKVSASGNITVNSNDKYIKAISPARLKEIRANIQAIKNGDKKAFDAYLSKLSKVEVKATLAGILLPYQVVTTSVQGVSTNGLSAVSSLKSASSVSALSGGYYYNYGQWDFAFNGTMRDYQGFRLFDFHFKMRSYINPYNGQIYGTNDFLVQPYIDNLVWYVGTTDNGGIYYKTCGNGNANYRCYALNVVWTGLDIKGLPLSIRQYCYFGAIRYNSSPNTIYMRYGPGTVYL